MNFKNYFIAMSVDERERFAIRCKTSRKHLTNIAYDKKKTCGEDLAMRIDMESGRAVTAEDLRPDLSREFAHLRTTVKEPA